MLYGRCRQSKFESDFISVQGHCAKRCVMVCHLGTESGSEGQRPRMPKRDPGEELDRAGIGKRYTY
jgi:hypothetical protein